tara:strand:- start:452 stop:613 length:162 start_codon:yes stop_codon:yes gene_type:complete
LVETNAGVPICHARDKRGRNAYVLADKIEQYEVITKAVHLGKSGKHGRSRYSE